MKKTASAAAAAGICAALAGCLGSNEQPLPARVTLDGIAGVDTVDTTASDVREAWGIDFPLIETAHGSSNVSLAPICAGAQQGVLIFLYAALREIRFYSGTVTDRGVGIGSTLADLRRAYGSRLRRGPHLQPSFAW